VSSGMLRFEDYKYLPTFRIVS